MYEMELLISTLIIKKICWSNCVNIIIINYLLHILTNLIFSFFDCLVMTSLIVGFITNKTLFCNNIHWTWTNGHYSGHHFICGIIFHLAQFIIICCIIIIIIGNIISRKYLHLLIHVSLQSKFGTKTYRYLSKSD